MNRGDLTADSAVEQLLWLERRTRKMSSLSISVPFNEVDLGL